MNLTERQADVLAEVMNLGMGQAANSLNGLVGAHVELRVPKVSMLSSREVQRNIEARGWTKLSTVQLEFQGSMNGDVVLLFPQPSAVKFVALLTGEKGSHAAIDGLRRATLEEAGNIILNGVVGATSNLFEGWVSFSIPYYRELRGAVPGIRDAGEPEVHIILTNAGFKVEQYRLEGEVLLCFEVNSLKQLLDVLDRQWTAAE